MSYRLPDLLIKERHGSGLVISLTFFAIASLGVCRGRELAKSGHATTAEFDGVEADTATTSETHETSPRAVSGASASRSGGHL